MQAVSFKRHRFPPDVIRLVVWLNFRFTLSFRDAEEMLAHRGIEVSHETVRCWTLEFGRPSHGTCGDPDRSRPVAGTWAAATEAA